MRWHKEGIHENDRVMGHRLYGEAWKVLDRFDARNVRFGLVTNVFDPFSTNSAPYSCWPIFAVLYNLPPSLCMKFEFMFLCLIVPGPKAPGPRINMMLKPLIEELKQLWIGVHVPLSPRPLATTTNSGVVTRAIDAEGCETNYYGIINKIFEFSFIRNKELKLVFFGCD
jgi:hypothetical protein